MIARGSEILEYIPHRPPIVMVDTLFEAVGKITVAGLTISKETHFCENGYLSTPGIVEHMAQSAAAGAGYHFKSNNLPIPLGFIGAVKNLVVISLPVIGSCLITEISIETEVFDITIAKGTVRCNEVLIATAELKIFISKDKS